LLTQYPGNFQAHYVKAVAPGKAEAIWRCRKKSTRQFCKFSSDPALRNLAQEGMTKSKRIAERANIWQITGQLGANAGNYGITGMRGKCGALEADIRGLNCHGRGEMGPNP